jgi:hypothetical protein
MVSRSARCFSNRRRGANCSHPHAPRRFAAARSTGSKYSLGEKRLLPELGQLWGAKTSVLPANHRFLGARTEFWHPTASSQVAGTPDLAAYRRSLAQLELAPASGDLGIFEA